jgi:protein-tyrosine phosphatase
LENSDNFIEEFKIKESKKRREELEKIKLRKTQANIFEKYLNDTGINTVFQLIFSEIIVKKIPVEDHFSYTAGRLRQISREIDEIKYK